MYIKIIILSLMITCSESSFTGISKTESPLRKVVPVMMDANKQFNISLNKALLGKPVNMPLKMSDDRFVDTTANVGGVDMNVTNFRFTNMRNCRIVIIDADIITLSIQVKVFCNAIISEGQQTPCQKITVDLKGINMSLNVDLKLENYNLDVQHVGGRIAFTRGVLRAASMTKSEVNLCGSLKQFMDKKILFYVKKTVETMFRSAVASIDLKNYFGNNDKAIELLKTVNRPLSKMINNVVDQTLDRFLQKKCQNGIFPVKNLDLSFSEKFLLITYSGKIQLRKGHIGNLKYFKKVGNLALFGNIADKQFTLLLKIHMREAFAYFDDMHTNMWGYRFIHLGGVRGYVESITVEVGVDVTMDMMGFLAQVNEVVLYIPQMGRIKTQIKSLGLLIGLIASFMQSLVTNLFHFIFVWIFEQTIQSILNENLVGKKIDFIKMV